MFSGREDASSTIQAVHVAPGPAGPHHFFGTSARPIGSGPSVSDVGHGAVQSCPLNAANGIMIPSRRNTASPRLSLGAAGSHAADDTSSEIRTAPQRTP